MVCGSMHNFAHFFCDCSVSEGAKYTGSIGLEVGLLSSAEVIGRRPGGFEVLVFYSSKNMDDVDYWRAHGAEYVAELWHVPCDGRLLHAPGCVLMRRDPSDLGATQFFDDSVPASGDW